ncbi:hypothetical protein ABK905_02635 [Acerihabitans sp. KWT182]|uniref:Uncharacterized protein n=1 Tax=Acerihabitans sp. KWT182 TaxID=3157919 RepID=A0AAU7QB98_9GAMM
MKRILSEHEKTNFNVNWINRRKIPVTSNELLTLFEIEYDNSKLRMSPLNLFLIEPEESVLSSPQPDYVLVAGEDRNDYKTLIDLLDYWNTQTLKEIVDQLKVSLREKKVVARNFGPDTLFMRFYGNLGTTLTMNLMA